jgi:hypothetical protein
MGIDVLYAVAVLMVSDGWSSPYLSSTHAAAAFYLVCFWLARRDQPAWISAPCGAGPSIARLIW